MLGSYHVKVTRRRGASFRFVVRRNLTVVRGDSGTGKTTLFEMIADHTRLGERSGVSIQCERECVALTDIDWKNQLSGLHDSIVFVDEGLEALGSDDFAREAKKSGNYFVIFSRNELRNLPYSVNEIYRIKTSGKYHSFVPLYKEGEGHRYSLSRALPRHDFDVLVTENSRSGLRFYSNRFEGSDLRCESAKSNSGIMAWLLEHADEHVFVIADGAAFGPYADRVLKLQREYPTNITVCLPESFEWLLLKAAIVGSRDAEAMLADPSSHIESSRYFSWERYFTDYLEGLTTGQPFAYGKDKLADAYMAEANASKVMALIACRNVR